METSLNWSNIFKFGIYLFIAIIIVNTIGSLIVGTTDWARLSLIGFFLYVIVPSFFTAIFILSFFAKKQNNKLALHLFLSAIIAYAMNLLIAYILTGSIFDSLLWVGDVLSLSLAVILVSVKNHKKLNK